MSDRSNDRQVRARLWSALDLALCGAGFWLAGPLPVAQVGGLYDDYLFVRLANFLLDGRWLGPYDALTLAKGPFYPMFLAACAALGAPIQVATEAVYLAGAVVLSRCVGDLAGYRGLATAALALLVFNPACFEWSTTTLMREPLYCGLTLLVLGLSARLFLAGGRLACAMALGGVWAAFWLTREEGLVLLPALALMACWPAWDIARGPGGLRGRGWTTFAQLWRVAVPLGVATLLVLVVCAANWRAYGVFRSNEFQSGPFPRAYGALARMVPDHFQALTPISRDMRLRAYEVSPSFRELQPALEGDAARFTTDVDCTQASRQWCHDIPGASFMWALRDAVARAGHYRSAHDADQFYKRLAREIDVDCAQGRLTCGPQHRGFLPPMRAAYLRPILTSVIRTTWDILRLGGPSPTIIYSVVQGPLTPAYDRLTVGTRISPPQRLAYAQGWQVTGALSALDPAAHLAVAPASGGVVQADLQTTPDPNAQAALHRQAGQGMDFGADLRCEPAACRLELVDAGRVVGDWPLAGLHAGRLLDTPEAALDISSVSPLASYAQVEALPDLRRNVMALICRVWPMIDCVGAPLALLCLLMDLRKRDFDRLTVLAASLLLAVAGRVLLLSVLDATTTGLQFRYESPVMGALLCFVCVGGSSPFLKKRTKKLSSI